MKQYCFIIASCIYPCSKPFNYSNVRSIYTPEERLAQTQNTIDTIHQMCPDADILLVENGLQDVGLLLHGLKYYCYIGHNKVVRLMADSPYKSLGELPSLFCAARYLKQKCKTNSYELCFLISGRYWLTDRFQAERFPHAFCFRHIEEDPPKILGEHTPILGAHSTRLMAFPWEDLNEFFWSLFRATPRFLLGRPLEEAWPRHIHRKIFYMDYLGVAGHIGVDKSYHEE